MNRTPVREITHGRAGTYTNYGCRCRECKEAHRRYYQAQRYRRRGVVPTVECSRCGQMFAPDGLSYHLARVHGIRAACGTESAYVRGCRCDRCRVAGSEARARYRYAAAKRRGATHSCSLCAGIFMTPLGLAAHRSTTHGEGRA